MKNFKKKEIKKMKNFIEEIKKELANRGYEEVKDLVYKVEGPCPLMGTASYIYLL